jgi:hypothetical protein
MGGGRAGSGALASTVSSSTAAVQITPSVESGVADGVLS